ncbi:MAG: SDR family NAD(P)-dependent oxidoreductase [Qingshengfaniella sp.]
MSFSVSGRTAIVTGAAHGLGLAVARHLSDCGARVMFADMDEDRLKEELGDVSESDDIAYFAGDLREKLTLANLMSATLDAFDRVDILVNASRQMQLSDPLDAGDEAVEQLLQQNLMTSLRMSQLAARRMIQQVEEAGDDEARPAGTIVNLSSIAARRSHPRLLAFSVSAAAVDQMTRSLALALAPHRIRVNGIACGSMMSSSLKNVLKENSDYRGDIMEKTPLQRIANAAEIAETVQYLASEGSGFMTGQILTLDGGRTLLDPVTAPAH